MAQTKAQLLGPVVGDVVMDVSTLSLDAEGNKVGIGHSEPDLTLHVSGVDGLPSTSGSTSTGHLTLRDKATSTKGMFFGVSNASPFGSWIQAQDSANNATNYPLLLNPNGGNVGIGDDDPNYRLVVTGQDQAVMIRQGNGALAALTHNTSQKLWFQGGNAELGLFSDSSGNLEYILGTWQSVTHIPLVFRTGNRAERMRITFDGNVGINQNNPTKKLEVAGGAVSFSPDTAGKHTHEFTTNASNDGRYFIKSDTTTKVDIQANGTSYFNGGKFIVAGNAIQAHANMDDLQVGDGNGNRGITISSGATAYGTVAFGDSADGSGTDMYSGFVEYYHDDNSMRLGTSSGEKVRIDNLGRVSIGNGGTFTAAAVGRSIVEINGTSSSLINLDVGGTRKAYHFTDGTDVYSYNTANGSYIIGSNDTERFRIDSAGGHRIKCSESWTAANLAECNTTKLALNINQIRQGQTKGIALGSIGPSGGSTGIQAYDTSNNSANPLLINPFGGVVGINKSSPSSEAQLDVVGSSYWPILVKTTSVGGGGVAIKNKDDVTSLYTGSGGSAWLTGSVITDGLIRAQNNLIFATNGNNERLRITSSGQLQHSAGSGDNQFISKRINTTSSAGDYFLHVRAQNNTPVDVGFLGFHRDTANDDARFVVGTRNTGGSVTEKLRITSDGKIGVGNDNPTVQLDVKRATAGTIAKFYDTGSNGGALYNGGPILGLSRISNGSVSVDGLLFQVGIDNSNSSTYNIDETVFCVGNRGVGIGEDDPQVNLHLSKSLGTNSSYKDAQMIRIAGTGGHDHMAGIGFGYYTANPATSAYPSAWIGAKVSSWTAYVKHDLIFATRGTDTNVEPTERFRITEGNELKQYWDSQYWQYGNFTCGRSGQTASNSPRLANTIHYGFGYQEAFSTSGGGWSHPYPDAVFGYHTGMRFGGNTSYGGCRFYADHPSSNSSILFSVGNGSTGVHVTNTLSKGGGSFRIAHPHPSKKWTHDLVHSFIEGPQMDLIYRGKIDLVDGSATVNIDTNSNMTDGTFVLLNRDVQCFTSNETGWTAVKGSVSGNILTITAQDNSCTDTISWMVVGERQDDKIKSLDMTDDDGNLIVEPLTIEETHM